MMLGAPGYAPFPHCRVRLEPLERWHKRHKTEAELPEVSD